MKQPNCDKKSCGECGYIVARTYVELLDREYSDHDAFISCVDLLELRRPGHERHEYFRCTAQFLGAIDLPLRGELVSFATSEYLVPKAAPGFAGRNCPVLGLELGPACEGPDITGT